jgi:hypothetical protein
MWWASCYRWWTPLSWHAPRSGSHTGAPGGEGEGAAQSMRLGRRMHAPPAALHAAVTMGQRVSLAGRQGVCGGRVGVPPPCVPTCRRGACWRHPLPWPGSQVKADTEGEQKINNSYQGLYRQMVDIMKQLGVEPVPTLDHPFDPVRARPRAAPACSASPAAGLSEGRGGRRGGSGSLWRAAAGRGCAAVPCGARGRPACRGGP